MAHKIVRIFVQPGLCVNYEFIWYYYVCGPKLRLVIWRSCSDHFFGYENYSK